MYINHVCNGLFNGKVVSLTDDTVLFHTADTIEELQKDIQQDILMLRMWFNDNYMIMSSET